MIKNLSIILFLFCFDIFAAAPYFISVDCKSTKKVIAQNTGISITKIPAKLDTIKDSSFTCSDGSCVWTYTIVRIDTLVRENAILNITTVDSCMYVDTLYFSFFDADNDSCKFIVAGLDSTGQKVFADSTWGNTTSRPGTNRILYFSHKKGFQNILPGIIQLSNLSDTVFEDIQYSSTSTVNAITDSAFYASLNGGWKKIFHSHSYNGSSGTPSISGTFISSSGGCFFDSNKVIEYDENKISVYGTYLDYNTYIRSGWVLNKQNVLFSERYYQIIVDKDTLITSTYYRGGTGSRSLDYYIYVRDPSIKFDDLPVKRTLTKNTDNFKLTISSNKMASIISFNLLQRQKVGLAVFDLEGRMVMNCLDQTLESGQHQINLNSASFTNKTYICRINAGGNSLSKQFTVLK